MRREYSYLGILAVGSAACANRSNSRYETCKSVSVSPCYQPAHIKRFNFKARSCPLYPRKLTSDKETGMSALCQKWTSGGETIPQSPPFG